MKRSSRSVLIFVATVSLAVVGCGTGQSNGQVGPAGPQGPAGPPGLTFRGPYASGTTYAATDSVTFGGSTYIALAANAGVRPTGDTASSTDWALLAKAGDAGATGSPGPVGATGVQGVPGPIGSPGAKGDPGATGLTYRGEYSSTESYAPRDLVFYNGSSFVAVTSSNGLTPGLSALSTTAWQPLALAGVDGAPGAVGPIGPQGPVGPRGPAGPPGGGSPDMGATATDTTLYNVIFGAYNAIPTGDSDTVYGVGAGAKLTSGREMTIVGARACANFDGDANANPQPENGLSTCVGSLAGANMIATGAFPSIDNVFVGQKAGLNGTALRQETFVGTHAATAIVNGQGDTVIGAHSLDSGTVQSRYNTVVGFYNLNSASGGDKTNTVVVGSQTAGKLIRSDDVILIGYNATELTAADNTIIIGDYAGALGTAVSQTVIVGSQAGRYAPSHSTIVGSYAAPLATDHGTYVGFGAGTGVTNGADNTCIGEYSCGLLRNGDHNVAVGVGAGAALSGAEAYTSALGANAKTAAGVTNAAQIGSGLNEVSNSLQFNSSQVIDGNGDIHSATIAPSANSTCTAGAIRVVLPYIYACVASIQWMRASLSAY